MKIVKLTDREHILKRPSMYIGGVSVDNIQDFYLTDDGNLEPQTLQFPPGLVKTINEVIDNGIDAITKTGKGYIIDVHIDKNQVQVRDNSCGFPVRITEDVEPVVLALGNARAGSNFNDDENVGQMGTNGVGAFATNCFSEVFEVITTNHKYTVKAKWADNAANLDVSYPDKLDAPGTTVSFKPDLAKFGLKEITLDIQKAIKTRLLCLAYTYPKILFRFNGDDIKAPAHITDLLAVGDDPIVHYKGKGYEVHVIARTQTTQNLSFVNGLNIRDGGTHLDVIANDLAKAFSAVRGISASKSDITNTLQLVFVGTGFKNLRFNSQTKEKITNSTAEVRDYLGDIDSLIQKVVKSKEIKDFIKATTQARELRANKSKLNQAKKSKIKSDKFLDSQGDRKILMLVEGESALGGLLPSLGRANIAYYTLMGKPLNAWSSSAQKLTANRELSELLSIVHNSSLDKIVFAQDADLDGVHIRGLLLGFFIKYLPEYKDRLFYLRTPVRGVMKNDEMVRWSFNLEDDLKIKSNETPYYVKGLGSWQTSDLKKVIEVEGFESLLCKIDVNPEDKSHQSILESWLGDKSQDRKQFILMNEFNIAKV